MSAIDDHDLIEEVMNGDEIDWEESLEPGVQNLIDAVSITLYLYYREGDPTFRTCVHDSFAVVFTSCLSIYSHVVYVNLCLFTENPQVDLRRRKGRCWKDDHLL